MLRRGCGPRKIAAKLSKKGVAKELAKEAFESVSAKDDVPDLPEAAKEALSRKLRSFERESDPAKRKAKALRFLAGRGFDSNTSFKALEAFPALFKRGFQPGGIPDED
jgi:SOS response regulatory protein OraA/RecX